MLSGRLIPFTGSKEPGSQAAKRNRGVIQIGRDRELLRLRRRVFTAAGFGVRSISPDEAPAEIRTITGTQVWVFCHTLHFYELALLAVAVRSSRPADKLLRLNSLDDIGQVPGLFDGFLDPAEGIDDLLRAVNELAGDPH